MTKILFKKSGFGTINFIKNYKQSLYKATSFACSLANRDKPVAATLQRKCSGGINFVIITKTITKINVPKNYFVIISARMVIVLQRTVPLAEVAREGANREKLTVKMIISITRCYFTVYVPYKPWKKTLRKPWKIGTKNPPFFHR